jgi:hypothetical protein
MLNIGHSKEILVKEVLIARKESSVNNVFFLSFPRRTRPKF